MRTLPKNLKIDHGYLQARISYRGIVRCKNFGQDDSLGREMAQEWLAEQRKDIRMQKFGIEKEIPKKRFAEVARLYLSLWSTELTPEGLPKHTTVAIRGQNYRIITLVHSFGKAWFDEIRPIDVQKWRDKRILSVLGVTADKEITTLSSIYSHVKDWIALEKIPKFKIPSENYCTGVEKAAIRKRSRILSSSELSALRASCEQLGDADLWEIIKLAVTSLLRTKDLRRLETGFVDMVQAKTGKQIQLPVNVNKMLNYINFRKRWEKARELSGLLGVEFRDLRKTGANLLKMKNHSNKLISEFLGHSNTRTTELYMIRNSDHLKPLAVELQTIVDSL